MPKKSASKSVVASALDDSAVAAEHARLAAEIMRHDALYFRDDAPEISDAAYDELRRRLAELEAAQPILASAASPSQKVGAAAVETFGKIVHEIGRAHV